MTAAVRARWPNNSGAAGFTLLEIVVVLVLIAVLAGGAVGLMMLSNDDRALKNSTGEIESLAKRARTVAALQQRPYALEFYGNRITMMPLAEAMVDPAGREKAAALIDAAGTSENGSGFERIDAGWELDPEMRMFVRRWASDAWLPIDEKNRQVWRFDPEGFCEPVGVRIQTGKSWMEVEFHPLTAGIRSTAREVY